MKTFLYLSDIHSNFEALKHLDLLPEIQDPDCEIRFGGDYIDGLDLKPNSVIIADENLLEYDDIEEYLFKHVHRIDPLHQDLLAMVYADIHLKKKRKG